MNIKNITACYPKTKGIVLVLIGASLWGISGTVAQYLFQQQGFSPEWLVEFRMLIAGIILLGLSSRKDAKSIWNIWKNKKDVWSLFLFSILGVLAVQYTYFVSIKNSNAATATVLQYVAPVLISCYLAVRARRFPSFREMVAVVLALFGTFLLATHGNIHHLSLSGWALFWGLSSAVSLAFYTLHPQNLLTRWSSMIVIGWGMLIGGIFFCLIHPPWIFQGQWSVYSYFAVAFVVIFGTIIAFYCYIESLNYISASEASLLACMEPLAAALLSVIWLQVTFGSADILGTINILSTIIILSFVKQKDPSSV